MNFDKDYMSQHGHGEYTRLDPATLPPLYLAWNVNIAGDSGAEGQAISVRWKGAINEEISMLSFEEKQVAENCGTPKNMLFKYLFC